MDNGSCLEILMTDSRGVARGCAKGARAHPLEKKSPEGSTGLKNDPQGRQVFPLAGTPLGKFLATLLTDSCFLCQLSTIVEVNMQKYIKNSAFHRKKFPMKCFALLFLSFLFLVFNLYLPERQILMGNIL